MRSTLTATQIIRSTVSDDFEKVGAPFGGLRSRLRFYLNRAQGQTAVAQEEFPQVQEPTLQKLDNILRPCGTVIHPVGGKAEAKLSAAAQQAHLDRIRLASPMKYTSPFKAEADMVGQLIGDLCNQLPYLKPPAERLRKSGMNSPRLNCGSRA